MPETPPPEQAAPDAVADALDAVEQAGDRAQELADELAGGFDDIEAVRASVPAGVDAMGDLDALLAAGADAAMDGGFELTDVAALEPALEPEPTPAPAPTPEPEPVAAAPTQAAVPDAVADEFDELAGGAFVDPAALSNAPEPETGAVDDADAFAAALAESVLADAPEPEPSTADAADAANDTDDADAFAAALAESVLADAPDPEPGAADAAEDAGDEDAAFAAALADSVLADVADAEPEPESEGGEAAPTGDAPPQVNPQRIQDAIAEMEALLAAAEEAEAAEAAAEPSPLAADTFASAEAEEDPATAAGGGAAEDEDELAGLFAAPEVPAASAEGKAPPVIRALSDESDEVRPAGDVSDVAETADASAPPIHPEAAAAAADADAEAAAGGLLPLGWLKALLALLHRPFGQMSDTVRLTLSGVALAVAIPGALLLSYALLLK